MLTKIVYALECPETQRVFYVGQSSYGLDRAYSHNRSHSEEVKAWVASLPSYPVVKILESDCSDVLARERYWINKMKDRGEPLLNKTIPSMAMLKHSIISLSEVIKAKRKEYKLTQPELAKKAGCALTVIRSLEQSKCKCTLSSLLTVLDALDLTLSLIDKE